MSIKRILYKLPVSREKFIDEIPNYFSHLNMQNLIFLENLYKIYISNFDSFSQIPVIRCVHFGLNNISTTLDYYVSRGWSLTEAKEKLKKRQSMSIRSMMERYNISEYDAKIKVNKSRKKGIETLNKNPNIEAINKSKGKSVRIEYWLDKVNPVTCEKYTVEEATIELSKKQAKGFNNFWQAVHSGKKVYVAPTSLQYFIDKGFNNPQEALKLRQATFSLNKCIEKYGEHEGLKIFKDRQEKWQATLNAKSEEEKIAIAIAKTKRSKRYSLEACSFIEKLLFSLNIDFLSPDVFYADNEYYLLYKDDSGKNRICFFDLYIKNLDLILEYNGSSFHPNPKKLVTKELWDKWVHPILRINADEMHNNDEIKLNAARQKFKHVFQVWDTDNHEQVITSIKEKIYAK